MVHRIEIFSRNPAMSRIIPRTIMMSLSELAPAARLEIGSVGRLLDVTSVDTLREGGNTPLGR